MLESDNQPSHGTNLEGSPRSHHLLQPGVQVTPSADYDAKVASRDYGPESKARRAEARGHEIEMRRQAREAAAGTAAVCSHSVSSPRAASVARASPDGAEPVPTAGSASALMPNDCFGCFIAVPAKPFPPPVPHGCIVFGSCDYGFDGKPYGEEYLVLEVGETVVYLNQEDQCWLLGRRAVWKRESLHHPIDDGRLFQGWFPPSAVQRWKIWRPEPDHAVRSLRGFFV